MTCTLHRFHLSKRPVQIIIKIKHKYKKISHYLLEQKQQLRRKLGKRLKMNSFLAKLFVEYICTSVPENSQNILIQIRINVMTIYTDFIEFVYNN